jgi:hypothetical protein
MAKESPKGHVGRQSRSSLCQRVEDNAVAPTVAADLPRYSFAASMSAAKYT